MAKLVAIGDSLTQGFQSGAIFRTDLSYPAPMARSMGLKIPTEFPIPSFLGSGLLFNIEDVLRVMEKSLGAEIDNIAQDTLIQSPPKLWDDILAAAEKNAIIWDLLLGFMG